LSRQEFTRTVRVEVIRRATKNNVIYCECCGLPAKKFQIDHVVADSHGGKPIIENAQLLCEVCYGVKNQIDTTVAAKLKRQEAKHIGAVKRPKKPLQSLGFQKTNKKPLIDKSALAPLPRRNPLTQDIIK
jgi:5-methylcytosine-specific restriction endonuclease McrA